MSFHLLLLLLVQIQGKLILVSGFSTSYGRTRSRNSYRIPSLPHKWCQGLEKFTRLHSIHSSDNYFERLTVTGASVSSLGFLAIVNSSFTYEGLHQHIAFPIQLTSSGTTPTISKTKYGVSNNMTVPSLFQEDKDQVSVTSPEALTFLQLVNGVDMATPILPPDTLSSLVVWYAFLLQNESKRNNTDVFEIEDELGLDASPKSDNPNEFYSALEYIRKFVQTMLFGVGDEMSSFLSLSQWQRSKIRLPGVKLRGVRVEAAETILPIAHNDNVAEIDTIPLKFVVECSVDDDSQLLEVPLFAVSESYDPSASISRAFALSEKLLQKMSHNFSSATSASFLALSLFHRYRTNNGVTLKVSNQLLKQIADMQNNMQNRRYCWIAPQSPNNHDMENAIQGKGLPSFRTLSDLNEADKRVLRYLEERNFVDNLTLTNQDNRPSTRGSSSRKKTLTVEQLAMQQKLKSAWKVATEKNDTQAQEKIQKAMLDFEEQVDANSKESSLQKIKRAMRENRNEHGDIVPNLIFELEDAIDDCDFNSKQ